MPGTYDPELNTVYWTVGNPGPNINGDVRNGDDLFTCSVIALDPDTGKRKWHYQFTPNDTHDWDSTEDTILVDRVWHGQPANCCSTPTATASSTSLDRVTGKLLSATPFVRATWVKEWDANGRPVVTEGWRASAEGVTVYPSLGGGTNFRRLPIVRKPAGITSSITIRPAISPPDRKLTKQAVNTRAEVMAEASADHRPAQLRTRRESWPSIPKPAKCNGSSNSRRPHSRQA